MESNRQMNPPERLRQVLDEVERRLRAAIPADREVVIRALLAAQDRATGVAGQSDLVTGLPIAYPGANKAMYLCLESSDDRSTVAAGNLDEWADGFLRECGSLVEAGLVLDHADSGFMRLVDAGDGGFAAWIATKREPPAWRERADFAWWGKHLAERHEPDAGSDPAEVLLRSMTYQSGYPAEAMLDGCRVETYLDVVKLLVTRSFQASDRGDANPVVSRRQLVAELASTLDLEDDVIAKAVDALKLDRENAAYHADVPGVAAPPLIRVAPDRLVLSSHGLATHPLLFLMRELRRRAAQDYHNSGHLREDVFRQDLYSLFQDKRFVTSGSRIELRRAKGNLRTDIDAAVFDRKTGTLALFELKSQDPFARSNSELMRRRDNVLYANRQVSGVLEWITRHGADEILNRVDHGTAKKFRVQKVFPFVLARYLVQFNDGPAPDRRAAWGTWPQVLRLLDGLPIRPTETNPIASLFTRLRNDNPVVRTSEDTSPHDIDLGPTRLRIYPSYAAFQTATA
jgi:hypothetical protein